MFLADETVFHGAGHFLEILTRMVQAVYVASGGKMPSHLVVFCDNTVAQAKNSETCKFLAFLVSMFKFASCNLLMLTEGHTHEDIDQFIGLLVCLVLAKHLYETPQDICELASRELGPIIERRGETFKASILAGVRDWGSWLKPAGVHLAGAFAVRHGKWAPHSFVFKLRQDLLPLEREGVVMSEGSPHDVFVLVKTYIHDTKLAQAPLLVWPAHFKDRVVGDYPSDLVPNTQLPADAVKGLQHLAAELLKPVTHYPRAADYIKSLCSPREGTAVTMPRLRWLTTPSTPRSPITVPTENKYYEHLPKTTWQMQVRFKN